LQELLQHLYVLIPVLDEDKHYWVGDAEVEILVRHAGEWLGLHPQSEAIARRYLKNRRSLAREALARLTVEDETDESELADVANEAFDGMAREQRLEETISPNHHRIKWVVQTVTRMGASRVVDLGCGEGKVLASLLKLKPITRIVGMDVSMRSLEYAKERLNLDRLPPRQRERIELLHGSLIYRDQRLAGFDLATIIEVIEHLDASRLAAFERVVFEFARPSVVLITTPNREYNSRFPNLEAGQFRHNDHRFEWTRAEFEHWASDRARRFDYTVNFEPIGDVDTNLGAPTQAAIFERASEPSRPDLS
jgi:3' terminal RNA ribose 2'-O-methyltransferase Hen1